MQTLVRAAAACAVLLAACWTVAAERPNFLLILADDVGRDAIGCYGGRSHDTPHIDQLAASGMRFRHGYVMPVCHPTRTTLLSGRYPRRQGRPSWGDYPAEEEATTVAALLRQAGYATAIAGKWQLKLLKDDVQQPHRMGFDHYCLFGWHEGPRYWQPMIYQDGALRDDVADRYGPDVYVEFLVDFMREHRDEPFFAFYSMALCHDVTDDLDKPVPYAPGKDRYESYAEMMQAMDQRVGRIVQAVERLQLRDRTLILFLGDNGTAARSIIRAEDGKFVRDPVFSETDWGRVQGGKGSLRDAGTRVPWIASWPDVVPAESTTDALVDASDLLPTLLELAGAAPPAQLRLDGRSFAKTLADPRQSVRDWVHAEQGNNGWVAGRRWKLYENGSLYDRQDDPLERQPLDELSAEAREAKERLEAAARELRE